MNIISSLVRILCSLDIFTYKWYLFLMLATAAASIILVWLIWSSLPWRVNCWFCNSNSWVRYIKKNCWTCPKCKQFNGLMEDGDYKRTHFTDFKKPSKRRNPFQRTPPKNCACKLCNKKQELKKAKVANYVPIDEWNYDEEMESYRMHCTEYEKVLQRKLRNSVFSIQSLNEYTEDSDSDLEGSFNSLRISNPKKKTSKNIHPFALRKFTASPDFATSTPLNRTEPVLPPCTPRSTWVAGGYWNKKGERHVKSNGNWPFSQSSPGPKTGYSQSNVFNQLQSNSDNVEIPLLATTIQKFAQLKYNENHYFAPVSSLAFSETQYNSHLPIPRQGLFQQTFTPQEEYANQQFAPNKIKSLWPGLINLPEDCYEC